MMPVDDGAILAWKDPPPRRGGRYATFTDADMEAILEPLRAHPGRWALVLDATQGACERLQKLLKGTGIETTVRRDHSTRPIAAKLYARWPEGHQ